MLRGRPARASAAHTWNRIFLWLLPGLSLVPLFFLGEKLQGALRLPEGPLAVGLLACFAFLILACGLCNSVLHLTRLHGGGNFSRRQVATFAGLFLIAQIPLAPTLAFTWLCLPVAYPWSALTVGHSGWIAR